MPRGRSREDMADMQRRRGPFTDPREGRLLSQIEWAFTAENAGDEVDPGGGTTSVGFVVGFSAVPIS